jgi:putative methyltransferase (TIGR04325 family)
MSLVSTALGLSRAIKRSPPVRAMLERAYEKGFAGDWPGSFRGVYATFAEAEAAAPKTKPLGYDHPGPASMYLERHERVYPSDYPVMFWLSRLLRPGARLFDLGGHVGLTFYAYAKYLTYPDDLRWTIYDVPAVRATGEELARKRGATQLSFTDRRADASGADVLLASGSLQYIEAPRLPDVLASLEKKPAHVVLNRTPLYDGPTFVTLQNIGTAYCPYLIFNRAEMLEPLAALGYELVDRWENLDHKCHVPFHDGRSLDAYDGLYLRLRSP